MANPDYCVPPLPPSPSRLLPMPTQCLRSNCLTWGGGKRRQNADIPSCIWFCQAYSRRKGCDEGVAKVPGWQKGRPRKVAEKGGENQGWHVSTLFFIAEVQNVLFVEQGDVKDVNRGRDCIARIYAFVDSMKKLVEWEAQKLTSTQGGFGIVDVLPLTQRLQFHVSSSYSFLILFLHHFSPFTSQNSFSNNLFSPTVYFYCMRCADFRRALVEKKHFLTTRRLMS